MPEPTAVVLVAHGSPDPDWCRPLLAVTERLQALLSRRSPGARAVLAYLGSSSPSVVEAVDALHAAGHRHVLVLGAFLSPGGKHIKHDVPRVVDELRARHPDLRLVLRPGALGDEPEVVEAMAVAAARAFAEHP